MALQKTTIYPDENPSPILNQHILKVVVLGNKVHLVKVADDLAIDPPTAIDRHVIWFKQPDPQLLLTLFPGLPQNNNIKAFSLSTLNNIADIIYNNEPEDYVRVDQAYTRAGLPEYN